MSGLELLFLKRASLELLGASINQTVFDKGRRAVTLSAEICVRHVEIH